MAIAEPQLAPSRPPWTEVLHGWLTTTDHKRLGLMYILMSLVFLGVAGAEATLMRVQLIQPRNHVLSPQLFNQFFTMHGTTMIFFVGMPMLTGFGNYLVPLMIGARDMAFPRLNALGFWLTLFAGLFMYYSFLAGGAPDVGWFGYAPLTAYTFSRGNNTDYWALGLLVSGIGTIATGVNFVATVLCRRAPGMGLGKLPLFVWMMFIDAVLMLFALPPLTAGLIMLLFDRQLGSHFFDTQAGGSAVLWQHIFWFFGHPEVYIIVLPAFGIISEVVPVFARKVIFGYELVALATIGIGFISFGVWAHHMFAVGMTTAQDWIFSGSSFLIAVPTGIKIFNWLATLYGGRVRFDTPLYFSLGFLSMFLIGGLTGIMLAAVPVDWQLTDSYFVVGHFHFVLFGGFVFGMLAGFHYWFPKATGRMLNEPLGKWSFWLLFVGFNLTFVPMHISGALGMPRRIAYFEPGRGWELWNLLATLGVFLQIPGFLLFVGNMAWSLFRGRPAGDDPWDAWTLEWSTTSPPPSYNFEVIPTVRSRRPLWDLKHPEDPDWKYE
jgi:cytochrome c oxidase subunit 1